MVQWPGDVPLSGEGEECGQQEQRSQPEAEEAAAFGWLIGHEVSLVNESESDLASFIVARIGWRWEFRHGFVYTFNELADQVLLLIWSGD